VKRAVGVPLLLLGLLLPFVPLVVWSFAATWRFPALLPQRYSLRPLRIVSDPSSDVLTGLATSTTIAVVVALVSGAIGLAAGRALGLHAFRGRRLVQFLLLAPVIVPGIAVSVGIQVVFIRYGLADTVPGVVLAHLIPTTPYVCLVMASTFAGFDTSFEDQARVLGASPWQVMRNVTLPAVLPGLAVAMTFAFLISWSEYVLTLLIGGGVVKTLPLLLFAYVGSADTPVAAMLSLVVVLPPLLLLVLTSRVLARRGAAPTGAVVGLGGL
jgi:putative spermidine/putrescine transport system permease protein